MTMSIPLSVPALAGNEWAYVKECLDTNWVSYVGPFVDRFERELAVAAGAPHAIATSSGTAALHIALMLAGVGQDDEVVMPGVTFVAPANAVRYCSAWPSFIDLSSADWQMDVEQVKDFLAKGCLAKSGHLYNKVTGRRIAAVLPVHLLGGMCDVDAIAEIVSHYELPLIEDAAECFGARYKDRPIGAPTSSYTGPLRLVATSFNGNKIITTGGGGAIFFTDATIAARAKHLTTTAKADKLEFYHDEVGYNYRLTNIGAALGVAQLEKLSQYVARKREIARFYREAFAAISSIVHHPEPVHCFSTFWLNTIKLSTDARPLVRDLNAAGIAARPIWVPMYELPAFKNKCFCFGRSFSDDFCYSALSLPSSIQITQSQLAATANQVCSSLSLVD